MPDKYISFTGENAYKVFRGLKTQTRRIMKPQPELLKDADGSYWWHLSVLDGFISWPCGFHARRQKLLQKRASPYKPGDIVLVREPVRYSVLLDKTKPSLLPDWPMKQFYPFTLERQQDVGAWGKLRPAMFLPRRFVRQAIRITEVRAERLQDISEADARAEGVSPLFSTEEIRNHPDVDLKPMPYKNYLWHGCATRKQSSAWEHQYSSYPTAKYSFSSLWESINGKGSWNANDWLWVDTFERCEVPEIEWVGR